LDFYTQARGAIGVGTLPGSAPNARGQTGRRISRYFNFFFEGLIDLTVSQYNGLCWSTGTGIYV